MNIIYFENILIPQKLSNLIEEIEQTLIELKNNGASSGQRFKKLKGHQHLYSLRLNDEGRLLFIQHKLGLILVDMIEKHDDYSNKLKNKNLVQRYLNSLGINDIDLATLDDVSIDDEIFIPVSDEEENQLIKQFNSIDSEQAIYGADVILGNIIIFDKTQKNIDLRKANLIVGAAGSGKTSITIRIVEEAYSNYLESHAKNKKILYLTSSERLADQVRQHLEQKLAKNDNKITIVSKSYQQFALSVMPELANRQVTSEDEFINWCGDQESNNNNNPKKIKPKDFGWNEKYHNRQKHQDYLNALYSNIYQEFKLISTMSTLDKYIKSGKKKSLFSDNDEIKCNLWNIYQKYKSHLGEDKYDLNFLDLSEQVSDEAKYDIICTDECQTFSPVQIDQVFNFSKNSNQIHFCGDNHQNTEGGLLPFDTHVQTLWKSKSIEGEKIVLSDSYRTPAAMVPVANAWLKLCNMVYGVVSKDDYQHMSTPDHHTTKGQCYFFKGSDIEDKMEPLSQLCRSPNTAIIVSSEEDKDLCRDRFGTMLVFTADEIIGLEYDNIICYDLFKSSHMRNLTIHCDQAKNHTPTGNYAKNQSNKSHDVSAAQECNTIFVALTRAKENLYIIDNDKKSEHKILDYLEEHYVPHQTPEQDIESITEEEQNQQWIEQCIKLLNSAKDDTELEKRIHIVEGIIEQHKISDKYLANGLEQKKQSIEQNRTNNNNVNSNQIKKSKARIKNVKRTRKKQKKSRNNRRTKNNAKNRSQAQKITVKSSSSINNNDELTVPQHLYGNKISARKKERHFKELLEKNKSNLHKVYSLHEKLILGNREDKKMAKTLVGCWVKFSLKLISENNLEIIRNHYQVISKHYSKSKIKDTQIKDAFEQSWMEHSTKTITTNRNNIAAIRDIYTNINHYFMSQGQGVRKLLELFEEAWYNHASDSIEKNINNIPHIYQWYCTHLANSKNPRGLIMLFHQAWYSNPHVRQVLLPPSSDQIKNDLQHIFEITCEVKNIPNEKIVAIAYKKIFIDSKPDLIQQSISIAMALQLINTKLSIGDKSREDLLHYLCKTDQGIEIITAAYSNHLTVGITYEMKSFISPCLLSPPESNNNYDHPLLSLAGTEKGIDALCEIFNDDSMRDQLTIELLTTSCGIDEYTNACVMFWLASREEGCLILLELIGNNQDILNNISLEVLSLQLPSAKHPYAQTNIFSQLSSSKTGVKILEYIKENSSLINGDNIDTMEPCMSETDPNEFLLFNINALNHQQGNASGFDPDEFSINNNNDDTFSIAHNPYQFHANSSRRNNVEVQREQNEEDESKFLLSNNNN